MESIRAAQAFAILGHPGRLAVFRLLMRFAPRGVRPTEIADALDLRPNTLSHHLADLTACGLAKVDRQGRSLFYSVDLGTTEGLIGYLALDVGRARPDLLGPLQPILEDIMPHQNTDFDVLFICSGNSARSIFAEVLLRDLGRGKFQSFSAGTRPNTELNPFALDVLRRNGHDVSGLRSKHISEFQQPGSVEMNFVFTVCDTAAAEDCPPWPGQPITGHWGLPDPARATGTDAERALVFSQTYAALRRRIAAFVELPFDQLTRLALQTHVDAIDADALTHTKG
ncbi:MAG: metalloregulator ArsR/SmtB family transcription factor [Pseudotabrizicola sp.]|uniref:metalloregulator ArsR/SmtB family transcription factor n=1 Tax=Pseudotabrizicola sp. TaxID=2939647 RepID=UPI00271BF9AE|nr:metalloregulator ArsR/SmtB family transcription factor [Pseudotabrizicola sp.]MDO8882668.1 metalloregulator ArsR/SmtB family transcription factor [Pseudotabrizicola sp.]MDP2080384.1 metalloregulator ArsR/SmtB family transcription factor [Pseudotabrizicola sp.]MDZ7573772.1 metalloregulator ArsR/SmtB family transcription factor [Pseudotabrizicola sp.]